MGLLANFFGGKKTATVSSTQDAIQNLLKTELILIKRQAVLETKIKKSQLLSSMEVRISAWLFKLSLESDSTRRLSPISMGFSQILNTSGRPWKRASMIAEVLRVMGEGSNALKAPHNNMDVEKVHDLMEDIAEQQEVATEIAEAISNPMGFGTGVDDDELLAELEALEQEEIDKQLLDSCPSLSCLSAPCPDGRIDCFSEGEERIGCPFQLGFRIVIHNTHNAYQCSLPSIIQALHKRISFILCNYK